MKVPPPSWPPSFATEVFTFTLPPPMLFFFFPFTAVLSPPERPTKFDSPVTAFFVSRQTHMASLGLPLYRLPENLFVKVVSRVLDTSARTDKRVSFQIALFAAHLPATSLPLLNHLLGHVVYLLSTFISPRLHQDPLAVQAVKPPRTSPPNALLAKAR